MICYNNNIYKYLNVCMFQPIRCAGWEQGSSRSNLWKSLALFVFLCKMAKSLQQRFFFFYQEMVVPLSQSLKILQSFINLRNHKMQCKICWNGWWSCDHSSYQNVPRHPFLPSCPFVQLTPVLRLCPVHTKNHIQGPKNFESEIGAAF